MPRIQNSLETALIGKRMRLWRQRKGMSQTVLADFVSVSYQQIQKYERGENELSVHAMKKIATALGVRPCEICGCCDE